MEIRLSVCTAQHAPSRGACVRTTAVGTARPTTSVSISGTTNRICSCQSILICVRPNHSLATRTGRLFSGIKQPGRETGNSIPLVQIPRNTATEWSTVPCKNNKYYIFCVSVCVTIVIRHVKCMCRLYCHSWPVWI